MRFRELAIHIEDSLQFPRGKTQQDFYRSAYHVVEGFMVHLLNELGSAHFLPEAVKLNVMLGEDDGGTNYFCALSVASCWVSDVDMYAYFNLSAEEQEQWTLSMLVNSLQDVAGRQAVDASPIERAAGRAVEEGFLMSYRIARLSKTHPSRKLRFNVVREIRHGGEAWWLEVHNTRGEMLERFAILEDTNRVQASGALRKSRWRGDTFLLTDAGGRIKYQKGSKTLIKKYVG